MAMKIITQTKGAVEAYNGRPAYQRDFVWDKGSTTRDYLHCYIKSDIMANLNAYIDETGYSKTAAVEKAIRMFLDSQKADKKSDKE